MLSIRKISIPFTLIGGPALVSLRPLECRSCRTHRGNSYTGLSFEQFPQDPSQDLGLRAQTPCPKTILFQTRMRLQSAADFVQISVGLRHFRSCGLVAQYDVMSYYSRLPTRRCLVCIRHFCWVRQRIVFVRNEN